MPSIIEEYDSLRGLHDDFRSQMEALVRQLLKARSISIHSISSRTKDRDSLTKKISKKGHGYNSIKDITDIIGIRIITYFSDQVDQVSELIEQELKIDEQNSIDKRSSLDPDRFGYLSVHYVCSLPEARCILTENRLFGNIKVEIQIRSILQHAWAEIEHDLGYKTKGEVPLVIRRQFARLAGLLELGDGEFVKIRKDIDQYEQSIQKKISQEPYLIQLDKVSVMDFIKNEKIVREVDNLIAKGLNCEINFDGVQMNGEIERLDYLGIKTIGDLKSALENAKDLMAGLSIMWGKEKQFFDDDSWVSPGVSIYYLCHILIGRKFDIEAAAAFYNRFSIGQPEDDLRESLAKEVIDYIRSAEAR